MRLRQTLGSGSVPTTGPILQASSCLTGFAARMRTGLYGLGQQVQSSTVTGAITAIGQTIVLACNKNPTEGLGSEKFLPALQIMIDGYTKADPPTQKKNYQSKRMFRNS